MIGRLAELSGMPSRRHNDGRAAVRAKPTAFGRRVQGMGPVDPAQINGVGFMLSDKKPGKFQMQVEWVKAARRTSRP